MPNRILRIGYVSRVCLLVVMMLVMSFPSGLIYGSTYSSFLFEPRVAASSPPVTLEAGTSGTTLIYTNSTSARISATAPAPQPTYYPNSYGIVTGTYVSGSVPSSVETVDTDYFTVGSVGTATSTSLYNPLGYTLIGSTTLVSGAVEDLASDDGAYMTFRSYASATSSQILYQHQDTTDIGGAPYYLQKLTSADAAGTSLSASMASTGRQIVGKSVYPLTGVTSIPASTWTMYYRAWRSSVPSIAYDAVGSGNNGAGSTSVSWSHTTGSGYNRIMIVGVSIRTTTVSVSSITYGAQSLTYIRADTHSGGFVRSELWYLIAPSSGTATVTVTLSGTSRATGGSCTYTGVDQSSPIDANAGGTGKSGSPSQSVTVNTANSWLLGHIAVTGDSKTVSSEGSGQIMRWNQVTTGGSAADRNQGHGSDKGPVGTGSQSMSWGVSGSENYAVSVAAFKPASPAVGHSDVDILIRQSDGTVRTTIATNVANSANLSSTASTLSGTYSWTTYTVVSQTDYLEIDYYVEVTVAQADMSAYIRIDDNTLATTDQTRTTDIYLPSEFTSEVEFTGSSNTQNWYQFTWNVDSTWNASSVSVTVQVYNYTSGGYQTSGNGYSSYTSSATPNTDETENQTITLNPTSFRNTTSYWRIKIKGVKSTTSQFDFKADWVEFKPSHYSEYSVSTEFMLSVTANTPTQLNFTVVSEYDISGVSVTVQIWNYSASNYATSGEGYLIYSSSGSNETKLLSINTHPEHVTSNGNVRIRLVGVLSTTTQYEQKANQVKLDYSYSASPSYNYVLKIVNQVNDPWKIRLKAYSQSNMARLNNCTIYFNSTDGTSGQIYVVSGVYAQPTGPWYDLPGLSADRQVALSLDASDSEVSYISVYLEILVPDKTTYAQYILTFEIT